MQSATPVLPMKIIDETIITHEANQKNLRRRLLEKNTRVNAEKNPKNCMNESPSPVMDEMPEALYELMAKEGLSKNIPIQW